MSKAGRSGYELLVGADAMDVVAVHAYLSRSYWAEGAGRHRPRHVRLKHADRQGLRRFGLATRDAHPLYEHFGLVPLAHPECIMEINRPGIYRGAAS